MSLKTKEQVESQIIIYNSWFEDKTMPKKNARILFNTNDKLQIDAILVAEFDNKSETCKKREYHHRKAPSEYPYYLYDYFMSDLGNCMAGWDDMELYPVIIGLLFTDEFSSHDLLKRFLDIELMKIDEYRKDMIRYGSLMNEIFPFSI